MRPFLFFAIVAFVQVVSLSKVLASQRYIVAFDCADVEVKTNAGQPGQAGAAVVTTSIRTESSRFRLIAKDEQASELIRTFSHGTKVSFLGLSDLVADAQGEFALEPLGIVTVCPQAN